MVVTNTLEVGFETPEVAVFDVDQVPDTDKEWSACIGELALEGVFEHALPTFTPYDGASHTIERNPDQATVRDWWSDNHIWHTDGTEWDKQPVFTVIGCQDADQDAPKTELLDTVRLLDISLEDGFWESYGISEDDLSDMFSIFAGTAYYRQALPYLGKFATDEEKTKIDSILKDDIQREGCSSLEDFLEKKDQEFPEKTFPLIRLTPISGMPSLFLDGGGRNCRLIHKGGQDFTHALHELRGQYLSNATSRALGIVKSVHWKANRCLILPQIGTLHRAQPGNEHNRRLHLGFLVNKAT